MSKDAHLTQRGGVVGVKEGKRLLNLVEWSSGIPNPTDSKETD
jgi:hypothetical protein